VTLSVHYTLEARSGQEEALEAALEDLTASLQRVAGFQGAEVFREEGFGMAFVFIERWTTHAARKAGGELIGKHAFASISAAVSTKPQCLILRSLCRSEPA